MSYTSRTVNGLIASFAYSRLSIVTDRISEGGNAIATVRMSVRQSVRPFVSILYLRNRLTGDFEILRVSRS